MSVALNEKKQNFEKKKDVQFTLLYKGSYKKLQPFSRTFQELFKDHMRISTTNY